MSHLQTQCQCVGFAIHIDSLAEFEACVCFKERLHLRLVALFNDISWLPGFEDAKLQAQIAAYISKCGYNMFVDHFAVAETQHLQSIAMAQYPDYFVGFKFEPAMPKDLNIEPMLQILREVLTQMTDIVEVAKNPITLSHFVQWQCLHA